MSKISPLVIAVALFAIICVQSIDGVIVPTPHKQCVDLGFAGVCRSTTSKLSSSNHLGRCGFKLVCAVQVGRRFFKQPVGNPQNGTPCGVGLICNNGQCIAAKPGIIYEGLDISKNCKHMVKGTDQVTPKTTPIPQM